MSSASNPSWCIPLLWMQYNCAIPNMYCFPRIFRIFPLQLYVLVITEFTSSMAANYATARVDSVLNVTPNIGEGPHWEDDTGRLLFVDISSGKLYRWHPASGELEIKEFGKIYQAPCLKFIWDSRPSLVTLMTHCFSVSGRAWLDIQHWLFQDLSSLWLSGATFTSMNPKVGG